MSVRNFANLDWTGVYSQNKDDLIEQVTRMFEHPLGPGKLPQSTTDSREIVGMISPHAGYVCSAPIAAHGYGRLMADRSEAELVIVTGPNHYGGAPAAISPAESWNTPIGEVPIHKGISMGIKERLSSLSDEIRPYLNFDSEAHRREHSIELQLPMLQMALKSFSFLPIGLFPSLKDPSIVALANLIMDVCEKESIEDIIAIASTDFSHGNMFPQLDHDEVSSRDKYAVDEILDFGTRPLHIEKVIEEHDISMCGSASVRLALVLSEKLGGKKASLLKYATSGETCGGKNAVVGYASIIFEK